MAESLPSLWGRANATVPSPPGPTGSSGWGRANATIANPDVPLRTSLWGRANATVGAVPPPPGTSPWGTATAILAVGHWDPVVWNGTTWDVVEMVTYKSGEGWVT